VGSRGRQEDKELSDETKEYINKLITTVNENIVKIDSIIEEHPGRAFNDYIDLAKKYADDKAGKFVHGILGSIYKRKLSLEDKVKN